MHICLVCFGLCWSYFPYTSGCLFIVSKWNISWWRHQMESFSALLDLCAGNSPVNGKFPAQRLMTRSFDVLFDLRVTNRLSKQSEDWWFDRPLHPLWRHFNAIAYMIISSTIYPIEHAVVVHFEKHELAVLKHLNTYGKICWVFQNASYLNTWHWIFLCNGCVKGW